MERLNLAVLISGRGSNLQALIDACAAPDFPARIAVVISNRPGAYGLTRAAQAGIESIVIDHKGFADKAAFEAVLHDALAARPVDLICLAGFMRVLGGGFIEKWPDRIINIHPSLLPEYKGLDTHARVLADGRTETGCTVHFVTPELDSGPIIVQKRVKIAPGDDVEGLSARVLAAEHAAYPEAVAHIARNRLKTIEESAGIGA
jgi:phosphoribosylglycinamide formyltransferase-1